MISATFHTLGEHEVCCVTLRSSSKPIFVRDGNAELMYIRAGNSTRQLTTKEALDYCKRRWHDTAGFADEELDFAKSVLRQAGLEET